MANKMLIDATHAEETRVVVCKGQRVEEFDLESQERRQLRGNIYLAKVTRVEPSLQAAFVDYGGNRHGFLAFSEIHPDYYQIPVSDRQELLKEAADAEALANESDGGDEAEDASESADQQAGSDSADSADEALAGDDTSDKAGADEAESASASDETEKSEGEAVEAEASADSAAETGEETDGGEASGDEAGDKPAKSASGRRPRRRRRSAAAAADTAVLRENAPENGDEVESIGAEDALEELPDRQVSRRRQYKIQEVIRRRQILLVQVVKEE
ncbi:MAG: S1 RNA-binding domain-containing protein, partial [Rhizobiales bacterium]|nr:S1 RNA-binding domain-containing protein [Hyphomicrobiales bacterium]